MTTREMPRSVAVERIGQGYGAHIVAEDGERAALARRFAILAIDRLEAEVRLEPVPHTPLIRLDARLQAVVRQACVVTLAPVIQHIDESFSLLFGPAEGEVGGTIDIDPDDPDIPEPFEEGRIDVGEALAQQLSLCLDPYPRAPGASFFPAEETESSSTPFAALTKLKRP